MSTSTAKSLTNLAEGKAGGVTKTTNFRVDPDLIIFEKGFNLRGEGPDTDQHVERLYQAYKAGAFIPPVDVIVVDGKILARDGHCRTKAARRLRKEMPEFTLECRNFRGNDADAVLHMIGTGTGGKPLTPLEAGTGYLRLLKFGLKPSDIAAKLGVSRVTVDNGVTLAEAPAEVQRMITEGDVSATTVREAIKQGPEAVKALNEAVKANHRALMNEDGSLLKPKKTRSTSKNPKKKVTARTLKGTAADKTKKKKLKTGKPSTTATTEGDNITITIDTKTAQAALDILRDFGAGDEGIKEMVVSLETALI